MPAEDMIEDVSEEAAETVSTSSEPQGRFIIDVVKEPYFTIPPGKRRVQSNSSNRAINLKESLCSSNPEQRAWA